MAYASTSGVGVLDAKTLKPVYEWKTAAGWVNWVDWAADGRHLVTHNGNKTVYVLRLPDLSFAADRKAAEYVLSIGGTVRVNGLEQDIRVAADLPKEAFHLTGVSLHRNPKVSDAGLACFKDCKNLTSLDLLEANQGSRGRLR